MGGDMSKKRHPKWDQFSRRLRDEHLRERGAICERCNRVRDDLEVHHIVPISKNRSLEFDRQSNLEIICRECHLTHHRKPVARDRADWKRLIEEELLNV